jgi:4-hydroxybenzoate polyprenyltransferase
MEKTEKKDIFSQAVLFLRMIKFSHSVFALPFAFMSALLAAGCLPSLRQIFWIAVAMVGARSGAMAMNRIIDRRIDARNPRTKGRELPAGKVLLSQAWLFAVISFIVLALAAYMLNLLCFYLSPVAIALVVFYSFTKRFTWASHVFLGLGISLAPLGAWIAVRGSVSAEIVPLVLAVICWLAGFDVLYALQDIEFDRRHGLFSIPSRFGIRRSLFISRFFHLLSVILLLATGFLFRMGILYWLGMAFVAALFIYEHSLVKEDNLSKLDMAFFNMNGWISVSVFAATALDIMLRGVL